MLQRLHSTILPCVFFLMRGREKGINKVINTYECVINIGANLRNDPELTGVDGCSWRPVLHAK